MKAPVRGLVAMPVFLVFGVACMALGGPAGLGGVGLLFVGAIAAGYLIGSPWALSIAAPFVIYGVATIDDSGPLENTDGGWGLLILVALAVPITAGVGIGLTLKAVLRRSSGQRP